MKTPQDKPQGKRERIPGTRIPIVFLKNTTISQFLKCYPHMKGRKEELKKLKEQSKPIQECSYCNGKGKYEVLGKIYKCACKPPQKEGLPKPKKAKMIPKSFIKRCEALQKEGWEERVRQRYLEEYVADKDEEIALAKLDMKNPWFEWWIGVMKEELASQRQEVEDMIEKLHRESETNSAKHQCQQEGYEYGLEDVLSQLRTNEGGREG